MIEAANIQPETCIWTPGEVPRGFEVTMLPERPAPVPAREAFATPQDIADDLLQRLDSHDGVRQVTKDEEADPNETQISMLAMAMVGKKALRAAINQSVVDPELAKQDIITPKVAQEYGLLPGTVFAEQEKQALANDLHHAVKRHLESEGGRLPEGVLEDQQQLTQIIAFESAGGQTNLYNFTNTQLSAEHVGRVANPLREMLDRTGGNVMNMLEVIAVLPNDDERLSPIDVFGRRTYAAHAVTGDGSVLLSEGIFNPDAPYPEIDEPTEPPRLGG